MALSGKSTADPLAFSSESLVDPRVLKLQEVAQVVLDPALRVPEALVRISLQDGRTLERRHDSSIPGEDLNAQQTRLVGTFRALSSARLPPSAVTALEQTVAQLECVSDVGELLSLTVVQRP
jgi:hypothetical protein